MTRLLPVLVLLLSRIVVAQEGGDATTGAYGMPPMLGDGTHTVVCTWCPTVTPYLFSLCMECLRTEGAAGGCVFDQLRSSQANSAAPNDWCPPGTYPGSCSMWGFTNDVTGHAVQVPMPTGYGDRPCSVEPPLVGQYPRPAAIKRAASIKEMPQPKSKWDTQGR